MRDKKTHLIAHEYDIVSLLFSEDGQLLYSIDGGLKPSLCVWLWNTAGLVQNLILPLKQDAFSILSCHTLDSTSTRTLLLVLNISAGYSLLSWDTSGPRLVLRFATELDTSAKCVSVAHVSTTGNQLATAEIDCIKLWTLSDAGIVLNRRLAMQQGLVHVSCHLPTKTCVALTEAGKVIFQATEALQISHRVL